MAIDWEKTAAIVSVLTFAAGGVGYLLDLRERVIALQSEVNILKSQVQVFGIAPSLSNNNFAPNSTNKSNSSSATPSSSASENPLVATCSDLAQRAAGAIEKGSSLTVADPIRDLMKQMGCSASK